MAEQNERLATIEAEYRHIKETLDKISENVDGISKKQDGDIFNIRLTLDAVRRNNDDVRKEMDAIVSRLDGHEVILDSANIEWVKDFKKDLQAIWLKVRISMAVGFVGLVYLIVEQGALSFLSKWFGGNE